MQKIDWYLLKKSVLEETTAEEEESIQTWLRESEDNQRFYARLRAFFWQTAKKKVDVEGNYERFIKNTKKHARRNTTRRFSYAAAACLIFGMLILLLDRPGGHSLQQPQPIVAGTYKAILYTGNGSAVVLNSKDHKEILTAGNIRLSQYDSCVSYRTAEPVSGLVGMHTMEVPHGGEFSLALSDGTQVYLNSMSRLKYPPVFAGEERRVELVGEAYFSVAHSEIPFIISVNGVELKVLGTEFNVRAYPDEKNFQTTLVEGRVAVTASSGQLILLPGEQAVLNEQGKLAKRKVDVTKYIAWKEGYIAFEDERLEEIMAKLAKWYNIEVLYAQEGLKDICFTGNINRYGDIRVLLNKIEKLDVVRFHIEENKITVTEANKHKPVL